MRPSHDFFVGLFYSIAFSLGLFGLLWYVLGLERTLIVWFIGGVVTIIFFVVRWVLETQRKP